MTSGIPVIAAESEPTVEQITDKETADIYGISGNTESLMKAINSVDNPLLMQKLSLKGRSEALKYTWGNATLEILDFLFANDRSASIQIRRYS